MGESQMKVIIADNDDSFSGILKEYIDAQNDFTLKRIVKNGDEVCRAVEEERPDILIMDILLPVLDGFAVLKQLAAAGRKPMLTVVASVMGQELLVKKATDLGAAYFVLKPVDIPDLFDRIRFLAKAYAGSILSELPAPGGASYVRETVTAEPSPVNVKKEATRLLHEIGIPANLKGHNYLRDAILMVMDNRSLIGCVTKSLYPDIGKRYQTSPCSVERAIRTALEIAWMRGKTEVLNDIFGFTVSINKGKPTNAEFIALIADKLSMECS